MVPMVKCRKQVDHGKATSTCFIFTTCKKRMLAIVSSGRGKKKQQKGATNELLSLTTAAFQSALFART